MLYSRPCLTICHACGDECRLDEITTGDTMRDEALAILGVRDESTVCLACAERAEREVDDAADALELDSDPAFASVCDARRDAWIEAMESAVLADVAVAA